MLLFLAKTEVIKNCPLLSLNIQVNNHLTNKELKLLANENTSSGTVYSFVWSNQEKPFVTEKHLSCLYMHAVYLYTHIYQGIWTMKPTDRCILKEGSAQTAHMAQYSSGPANASFKLFIFITQCQDSRRQDPGSRALCRGWKTYLKVVRWQRNDETLSTTTVAQQRLLRHPPPARTSLCASVCIDTDILKFIKIPRSLANRPQEQSRMVFSKTHGSTFLKYM